MPKPRQPATGVIVREAHLQIDLRRYGLGRERLELAPTPTNIRYAERLRNEILGKIERGSFALADYFPNSPRAKLDTPSMNFGQVAAEWLKMKRPAVQHSTAHHYEQTIGSTYFDSVRDMFIADLDYRKLMSLIGVMPANVKTFNNFATVLRQIFAYAFKAKLIREPLHEHIVMRRLQKAQPDPLTLAEVRQLLASFENERARTYDEVAFFTGL